MNLTLSCTTGVPLGRRPACTWCPLRASTKRTVRSVPFGSLAEWTSCVRAANEQTGTPPIAEGTSRRSGGQAIRLHLVSNSFVDEFDVPKRHSARWPNGILTSGLPTSRPTQHRSTRGQRTTQQRANRRRHKPPIRRAGRRSACTWCRAIPPDAKKPHIRLVGRIGCQAT